MTETTEQIDSTARWQFWIDVGGTFTDCFARAPDGAVHTVKVLSSATIKGVPAEGSSPHAIVDAALAGCPEDAYRGFALRLLDAGGHVLDARTASGSDDANGAVRVEEPLQSLDRAAAYELRSPEEAPLLAIRRVLGLRLDEPVGAIELRLGTTRGTNALLERKGARTAFVTTTGFGDAPRIGFQDRPRLFDLAIRKPPVLFERAVEIDGRLDPDGNELLPLDEDAARDAFRELRTEGVEALAICLLHATANDAHEVRLGELARDAGFRDAVLSSRSSPVTGLVMRGDSTLVDAYLTPVVRSYVDALRASAPVARTRLLTSAGGLSSPEAFQGKDSILSGPAGGVVGSARSAEATGFAHAIGFDMGGTSTDVSRWDGAFEMEFETEKAGVRIATPLLAIETVAAGGGSICAFDGERLTVGPHSAGAHPGPACYGAGGPLTVTDVNLLLGRIPPERFPFPLDRDAVERRLDEIGERMASAGHPRSTVEIAGGCLEIAVHHMAAAIRKISVARGYDVREYALVTFGGAGAQHACAIARELGMRTVLVPELAGILSAQGAGQADVRKFAQRPVTASLDDRTLRGLEPAFASLEDEVRRAVSDDGIAVERIDAPSRSVDLRYVGQDATLRVEIDRELTASDATVVRQRFEAAHEQLYGFTHSKRKVEIVVLRAECVGSTETFEVHADRSEVDEPREQRVERRTAWFGGQALEALVANGRDLRCDETLDGPAILACPFHTIVVEPGWSVRRDEHGNWLLEDRVGEKPSATSETARRDVDAETVDPARLEIFHRHFAGIAEEMGLVLRRSALSTNVRERLDFSCAVFDEEGGLVANAPHIPVHLGAMSDCVRHVSRDVPDIAAGDVIVTNDPYRGGSHLPDVTVVSPVYDASGERRLFWVASRAHHAEIGGKRPGSMPPDSTSLADEGVLLRNVRAIERGAAHLDRLETALRSGDWPSRNPEENLADIAAQIAANRTGETLLRRLADEHGVSRVTSYMRFIQDAASRLMSDRLREIVIRRATYRDQLDDGAVIQVTVTIDGGRARVDFTGTAGVLPGNLNATAAIVSSAVLYCFRCLIDEDIPLNGGVLDPIDIVLPECCLAPPSHDDPRHCAAVAGGNVETSQRIVDVVLGSLGVVANSQGTMNNLLFGNERFGYYETIAGGAGAGPDFDGADAVHTHMTNTRITDAEIFERRYPARLHRFAIRTGSGGRGTHRGGSGVVREIEFLDEVEVSLVTQRRTERPRGAVGGEPGRAGRNLLRCSGEDAWRELASIDTFTARRGDRLRVETPGGGGWGDQR